MSQVGTLSGAARRSSEGDGSLTDSLMSAPAEFTVGFVAAPGLAAFVRRDSQQLETKGVSCDIDRIYDCRLFAAHAEWHWWWDQSARAGRWSLLDDNVATSRGWSVLQPTGQRLLRGTVHRVDASWSLTHDGHSRPLWVPVAANVGDRLVISATEYVCAPDLEHGNVGVVAERLGEIGVLS